MDSPHDSNRHHRRRHRWLERHFNTASGSSNLMFPMGSQTMGRQWGNLQQQGANPMLMGFGFGPTEGRGGRQYTRFQEQLGTAQGPMAEYIRQGQQFLPQMMPGLQQVGADVAGQSQAAFQNLLQSIQQGQGFLGQGAQGIQGAMGGLQGLQGQAAGLTPYQQAITQHAFGPQTQMPLQAGQQALGLAGRSAQGAFGPQAQQGFNLGQRAGQAAFGPQAGMGFNLAQAGAQGVFGPQAQQGLDLARHAATQAFNPLQNQTLYQQALAQANQAAQQGAASRGLLAGGAGQAAEESAARALATQFAGQQHAQQQQALSGLANQQTNLANLQQAAAAGVGGQFQNLLGGQQQAAQNLGNLYAQQLTGQQNAITGLGGQAAGLQGLQGGLQNLQQGALQGQQGLLGTQAGLYGQGAEMANALAALGPQGAQLAGMGLNAMPLYQQGLAAQYALPFAGMQDLQGFFTGAMQPGMGLLQAAMPQVGTNTASWGIL